MSMEIIGLLGVIFFLILMFLRVPVAVSMAVTGVLGFAIISKPAAAMKMLASDLFAQFASYNLTTIAMFVLMGYFASHSGISSNVFDFAYKIIGRLPGGLAIASVFACVIFGAISGSYAATAAIVGAAAIPEMKRFRYDNSLSTASIAAGGVIGVLIPPSMTFIIYGISTEQPIGKLFLSGIIPGILYALCFIVTILILVRLKPRIAPVETVSRSSLREIITSAGGIIQVFIVFVISIGGLFLGWFTATEAGGVGAAGILLVAVVSRNMTWTKFMNALKDTTITTAMIMFIIGGATLFSRFIVVSRFPDTIGRAVRELNVPDFVVILLIFVVYIFLGTFLETIPMILLTIPIFYPIAVIDLGYDPIWFGTVVVMSGCIGALTPPVGQNVYVVKGIAKDVPLETIFRGVMPFVLAAIVATLLVIFIPEIALFLPNFFSG